MPDLDTLHPDERARQLRARDRKRISEAIQRQQKREMDKKFKPLMTEIKKLKEYLNEK